MTPIDIIMEEYRSMRSEILLCLEARPKTTGFGITALSLIGGTALAMLGAPIQTAPEHAGTPAHLFSVVEPTSTASLVWTGAILLGCIFPMLAIFVLQAWFSESHRLRRASWYLWKISEEINGAVKKENPSWTTDVLQWEKGLRGHGRYCGKLTRTTSYYYLTIFLYSLFIWLAISYASSRLNSNVYVAILAGGIVAVPTLVAYSAAARKLQIDYDELIREPERNLVVHA